MSTDSVLYNNIGAGYNATRKADPYLSDRLFNLLSPQRDNLYLDIGCGTGNYTIALSEKGLRFWGVEPSEKMLAEARERSQTVNWVAGTAEALPAPNEQFNGAIATLTIHHWLNLVKGFSEISRVLKPDAKLVIFTATPEQMQGYWLNHYFPQMLLTSIAQMPPLEEVETALTDAGFEIGPEEKYFVQDDLQDHFLYCGKSRPELYFDANIRHGISSFAALANREEAEKGLAELKQDIVTGRFKSVADKYLNNNGDYLFIVARKPHN